MNQREQPARLGLRGQAAIAVTLALLGFLLATQLRAEQGLTQRLAIERESDLGEILSELTARSDDLVEEIVDLRVRIAQISNSRDKQRALLADARDQLRALRVLLGVVPVHGPGIVMKIDDRSTGIGPDVLLDAVQELRDAGAEAIAINGVRVVAQTAFTGDVGAIRVASKPVRAPYVVLAIGPAETLAQAMKIPGGVADNVGARHGASVRIDEKKSVSISAVAALPRLTRARPGARR